MWAPTCVICLSISLTPVTYTCVLRVLELTASSTLSYSFLVHYSTCAFAVSNLRSDLLLRQTFARRDSTRSIDPLDNWCLSHCTRLSPQCLHCGCDELTSSSKHTSNFCCSASGYTRRRQLVFRWGWKADWVDFACRLRHVSHNYCIAASIALCALVVAPGFPREAEHLGSHSLKPTICVSHSQKSYSAETAFCNAAFIHDPPNDPVWCVLTETALSLSREMVSWIRKLFITMYLNVSFTTLSILCHLLYSTVDGKL